MVKSQIHLYTDCFIQMDAIRVVHFMPCIIHSPDSFPIIYPLYEHYYSNTTPNSKIINIMMYPIINVIIQHVLTKLIFYVPAPRFLFESMSSFRLQDNPAAPDLVPCPVAFYATFGCTPCSM